MNPFSISLPLASEAASAFKTVSDVFSIIEKDCEKINQISDDVAQFSVPITFGSFRLLLDGQFEVVDRDLDNFVALYTLTSKDRGGKGRLDGKFRLFLLQDELKSSLECEVELVPKGMIARVDLPMREVLSLRIENLIYRLLENNQAIVIDDFKVNSNPQGIAIPEALDDESSKVDKFLVESMVQSNALRPTSSRQPLWVAILRFPAKLVSFPFNYLRSLFSI